MHDEDRLHRIREYKDEAAELRREFRRLQERMECLDTSAAHVLHDFIQPTYTRWRPAVGDTAFYVDAIEGLYFTVVVREVHRDQIRTQASHSPNHRDGSRTVKPPM